MQIETLGLSGSYAGNEQMLVSTTSGLFYTASEATAWPVGEWRLYKSPGTVGAAQLLAQVTDPNSYGVRDLTALGSGVVLVGNNGPFGEEPWVSDGTTAGTTQLDILPATSGFQGGSAIAFGDKFLFSGYLPNTGNELWITDGTVAGTQLLVDIRQGPIASHPGQWFPYGDAMLFGAHDGSGYGIWRTDGTAAGTSKLATVANQFGGYDLFYGSLFDGIVYFRAASPTLGVELWLSLIHI